MSSSQRQPKSWQTSLKIDKGDFMWERKTWFFFFVDSVFFSMIFLVFVSIDEFYLRVSEVFRRWNHWENFSLGEIRRTNHSTLTNWKLVVRVDQFQSSVFSRSDVGRELVSIWMKFHFVSSDFLVSSASTTDTLHSVHSSSDRIFLAVRQRHFDLSIST